MEVSSLHASLDVPLLSFNLGELFLTKFTVQRLDEAFSWVSLCFASFEMSENLLPHCLQR